MFSNFTGPLMGEEFYPMMNHRVLTILELDDFGGVISVSFELKFG